MAISVLKQPVIFSESSYGPSNWLKNINEKVRSSKAERYGNVIYISFTLLSGLTYGETLFEFNDAIKPRTNSMNHVWPIFMGSGAVLTGGSVWIERNHQVLKYYGIDLPDTCYCMISYIV